MVDKNSDYGCIRFNRSSFSRLATEVGNIGCMSADGTIHTNAFAVAERTTEAYLFTVMENNGGQVPAEFYVLARQVSQQVLLHALYVSAGRQVFQFTPLIQNEFKRTDLSGTPIGILTLPYPAGFLHFGRQLDQDVDDEWRVEAEYFDGAYFHCGPEGQLTILLTFSRADGSWSGLPGPGFSINPQDLDSPAHCVVDKALDADMAGLDDTRHSNNISEATREWDAAMRPVLHSALSLVLNALFYLDAYGADTDPVVPDSAPASLQNDYKIAAKTSKAKVIRNARNALMADGFTVVRMCGTKLGDQPGLEPLDNHRHGVRPHWRRGHWRMQPCGPKLSQVKRVWIRPMLVGKGTGGVIQGHHYVVGTQPETL